MAALVLTQKFLTLYSNEFDPQTIFQLVLSKKRIRSPLDALELCGNLRYLDLNDNEITTLGIGLLNLSMLEHLELKNNKLTKLDGLPEKSLSSLRTLRLENNQLVRVSDLEAIKGQKSLQHLSLQAIDKTSQCPVCGQSQYRSILLNQMDLPNLRSLDYIRPNLPQFDEKVESMKLELSAIQSDNGLNGNGSGYGSNSNSLSNNSESDVLQPFFGEGDEKRALIEDLQMSPNTRQQRNQSQDYLFGSIKSSKDLVRELYTLLDKTNENLENLTVDTDSTNKFETVTSNIENGTDGNNLVVPN